MLILTRKKDEVIVIDGDIRIQIVDVRSDEVRIGIEAPKSVKIYRKELWESIQSENIKAMEEAKAHSSTEVTKTLGKRFELQSDPDPDPTPDPAPDPKSSEQEEEGPSRSEQEI